MASLGAGVELHQPAMSFHSRQILRVVANQLFEQLARLGPPALGKVSARQSEQDVAALMRTEVLEQAVELGVQLACREWLAADSVHDGHGSVSRFLRPPVGVGRLDGGG